MSSTDSSSVTAPVHVVGGGLAGAEAAYQLGRRGISVILHEMRPVRSTEAHQSDNLAELVCSNTLGNRLPHTAPGIFKEELSILGSLIVASARAAHVAAGGALAVDRELFSRCITGTLSSLDTVEIRREEVEKLSLDPKERWILATGPLTSPSMAASIREVTGTDDLYFYDAIAPIVDSTTVDHEVAFWANRYGAEGDGDYLNLPLNRDQYEAFVDVLLDAEQVVPKNFEEERFFQACQPIEAIASKGRESLRFGPMKPVGLTDPRTGRWAYAVVQLRRETHAGTAMNLVGFQTKLKYGEQSRVFRSLPGLAEAEFLRLGSVHRNTYLNSPRLLDNCLRLRSHPHLSFAGQVVGCEGYTESSAMGLWAALCVVAERRGRPLSEVPRDSMLGALLGYLRDADPNRFQHMNVNFGLLPSDGRRVRKKQRKAYREERGRSCVASLRAWAELEGLLSSGPAFGEDSEQAQAG